MLTCESRGCSGLFPLLAAVLSTAVMAAADKPNIVLLFADDLGRYASAYADPALPSPNDVVKTPVFDRIAAEGARFDNAFVSAVPLTMRWSGRIESGRVVKAPVSLIDLAPTFLAAAGTESPDDPDGQNLLPALAAEGDDGKLWGWALIGREVHVGSAREDFMPYPVRALRTADFLYVKNFKPDRWPMGDPKAAAGDAMPDAKALDNNRAAYADIDASPTKTWLIRNRFQKGLESILRDAWEKRPEEELYILADDPQQIRNVAADPNQAATLEKLRAQLIAELEAKQDPRLTDAFDRPPYLDKSRE